MTSTKKSLRIPFPNDLEAVKLLAAAPAVLDLYMWLSYRCFKSKEREAIPIFGDFGLANQLGCVEYSRPRRFRAMLEQWLTAIRAIWPECPAQIAADGQSIQIRKAVAVCERCYQIPWGVMRQRRTPKMLEFPSSAVENCCHMTT